MIFLYLAMVATAIVGWVGVYKLSQELNPRGDGVYDGQGWVSYFGLALLPYFVVGVGLTIFESIRIYS